MSHVHDQLGIQFINIPRKVVEFEDGHTVAVEPFVVSKRFVTVGMFDAFQKATGHVTTSERKGGKVFRYNEVIEHMSRTARLNAPAFCVSFTDALRFCEWAEVRLPSEAEWLAASLFDDRVYDVDGGEECPWCDKRRNIIKSKLPEVSESAGEEWTATRTENGLVVTRSGPIYFRDADWRSAVSDYRYLRKPDEWDLLLSFRVCKLSL
jgi:hypothetical protein